MPNISYKNWLSTLKKRFFYLLGVWIETKYLVDQVDILVRSQKSLSLRSNASPEILKTEKWLRMDFTFSFTQLPVFSNLRVEKFRIWCVHLKCQIKVGYQIQSNNAEDPAEDLGQKIGWGTSHNHWPLYFVTSSFLFFGTVQPPVLYHSWYEVECRMQNGNVCVKIFISKITLNIELLQKLVEQSLFLTEWESWIFRFLKIVHG